MNYFNSLSVSKRVGLVIAAIIFAALVAGSGSIGYLEVILVGLVLYQLERIRKALK